MRMLAATIPVALLAVLVLGRSVFGEPPPPMEARPLARAIAALEKAKGRRADLAAARFYAEVFDGTTVQAPVGSPPDALGAWGDDGPLMNAEASFNGCAPLAEEKQKRASVLAKEFGGDLPVLLRAYTLAGEGKTHEAADLFVATLEASLPAKGCPGEHPMYSNRRERRMGLMLACVKTLEPKRDVSRLEALLRRAILCTTNNHAVG